VRNLRFDHAISELDEEAGGEVEAEVGSERQFLLAKATRRIFRGRANQKK
jgi:hypothetical protein